LSQNSDAVSAYERAKTAECKEKIEQLACILQNQSYESNRKSSIYDLNLNRTCAYASNHQLRETYVRGCLTESEFSTYVSSETEIHLNKSNDTAFSVDFSQIKQLQTCIDACLGQVHLKYAAFHPNLGCICVRYLKSGLKESLAPTIHDLCNKKEVYTIYHTGLIGKYSFL
jgi:hypothetical protein